MSRNCFMGICLGLVAGVALVSGCTNTSVANVPGAKYLASSEPAGAKNVAEVRDAAKDQDEVVVVGRIGGAENPWVEGQAAFTLVDTSLVPCNEKPGDECATPWDYCCDSNKLPTHSISVQVVDAQGQPEKTAAKEFLHVKELQTLVIKGKVQRKGKDDFTLLASSIHVRTTTEKK